MPAPHHPRRVLALLLLATACGGGGDAAPDRVSVQVDTLGDTIVVRTLAGSAWGDTGRLVPELTIGVADGPEEYLLGRIRSLAVSPQGEIYLMDAQVPALRKYAADGSYLMTLGREGSGPGEYRQPDGGLAVLSDGRVVLRDPGNARFAIYAADGSYLEQWPVTAGFNTGRKLYRSDQDHVYTMVLLETDLPPWQWTYGMSHYAPDGTILDTLVVPKLGYEPPTVRGQRDGNSSTQYVPFTPTAPWAFSPLGYAVSGIGDRYRFTLFRPEGPLVIEKAADPVAVLPEEGAERRAQVTWDMEQNFPGWRWNGDPVPDTKPAFTDLMPAEDGRIWVRVSTRGERVDEVASALPPREGSTPRPESHFLEPVAFDVFEPDGRYLGHVVAPEGFQTGPTPVIRGDTVWAVTIDPELGIPQVVRYRIAR